MTANFDPGANRRSQDTSLPSFDERVGAWIVDALASLVLCLVVAAVVETASPFGVLVSALTSGVVWATCLCLVAARMESGSRRGTPGKIACGLVVVGADGAEVTFRRALVRNLAKFAVPIPVNAAFVMTRQDRAALHDLVARTRVRHARARQEEAVGSA